MNEINKLLQTYFYFIPLSQIIITMIVVPIIAKRYQKSLINHTLTLLNEQSRVAFIARQTSLNNVFIAIQVAVTVIASLILYQAWQQASELFQWDNQAGLMILAVLGAIPFVFLCYVTNDIDKVIRSTRPSIRSSILQKRHWLALIPKPGLMAIAALNLILVAEVGYFYINPFPGFAGIGNIIGFTIVNGIFLFNIYFVHLGKGLPADLSPEQKQVTMQRVASIITILWSLALLYLGLSFFFSGFDSSDSIKLLSQSVYFQVMFIIASLFIRQEGYLSR